MDKVVKYSSFSIDDQSYSTNIFEIYKNLNLSSHTYSRIALNEILKSHNKVKIQNIYLPSLVCRDILSSISNLNYNIIYYEVNEKLEPILNNDIDIDILIIINYFGFPQNLDFFKKLISKNNCITIEDNSHGFLSRDDNGQFLGTRLNYGFISIYKTLNLFNGAILINNYSKNIINTKFIKKFDIKYFLKKFIYFKLINSNKKNVKIYNIINTFKKILKKDSFNLYDEYILPNDKIIFDNLKLKSLPFDYEKEISRRKKIFFNINSLLENEKIKPIFVEMNNNTVPYCYPFYCESKNISKIKKKLNLNNYITLKWPLLPSKLENFPKFYDNLYFVTFKI